jgi:hypothetical protein
MLERNVGGRDRQLRAGGALLALVGAGLAWGLNEQSLVLVGLFVALGLGFNAITGFCWGNKLLGIDSCSRPSSSEEP